MIAGLAGGDALEIIVALKDLSEAGFRKVEGNLKHLEGSANATNLGGASKSLKTLEQDAESAAGKKGGGGIGGLASGLLGLVNPVMLATGAIATIAGAGMALTETYDKIEVQEKALAIAAKDHGISMEEMNRHVESAITYGEQYSVGASDMRDATIRLTEAGMSLADQQASMPHILDLAKAKSMSAGEAARMYELALMGNQRALKDLGIVLPKVTASQVDAYAKTHHLTTAQAEAALKAQTLKLAMNKLEGAIGGQRAATTPLAQAQTALGNQWQKLATAVGPGLEDLFTRLIKGIVLLFTWVMNVAGAIGKVLGPVFNVVGIAIGRFADGVRIVLGVVGNLFNMIGQVGHAIANSPIGSLLGGGGDALRNIASLIPHFASGGVVEPRAGGRLVIAGEAGEREWIVPESKMGTLAGGGSTTHHTHIYLDGMVIADIVEKHLGNRLNLRGSSIGLGNV